MARMEQASRLTDWQKRAGVSGAGVSAVSWALPTILPDLPFWVPVTVFAVGLLLVGSTVFPHIHERLTPYIGKLGSLAVLIALAVSIVFGFGWTIYKRVIYKLSYTMCFSHELATHGLAYEPQVSHMNVAPVLINGNDFAIPVQFDEASLRIGTTASEETKLPKRLLIKKHQSGWGYLDYVEFNPPIKPGPMTGQARYVIHFGNDPKKPLDKTLVIQGEINGAISPDGHVGGFNFIPDFGGDTDPNYVPRNCRVPPEMYYVANKH
jgi:hypothetical protein